jgi:hypothetical protein
MRNASNTNYKPRGEKMPKREIRNLSELLVETDEKIKNLKKLNTSAFPTRELVAGRLYLNVGLTNGGKTF